MSAIDIVVFKLQTAPVVTEIIGEQSFPILAPQDAIPPYTTVHLIDSIDIGVHQGGAGKYWRSIIQVNSLFSGDISGAGSRVVDLGNRVIEALDGTIKETITGHTGVYRDVDILLGSGDNTGYDNNRNAFSRMTRFNVTWRYAA